MNCVAQWDSGFPGWEAMNTMNEITISLSHSACMDDITSWRFRASNEFKGQWLLLTSLDSCLLTTNKVSTLEAVEASFLFTC